jgi:hypothetical protein
MLMPFMHNGTLHMLVRAAFNDKTRPGALRESAARSVGLGLVMDVASCVFS